VHRIMVRIRTEETRKVNFLRARETRWTLLRLRTAVRRACVSPGPVKFSKKTKPLSGKDRIDRIRSRMSNKQRSDNRRGRGHYVGHRDCRRGEFGGSDWIFPIPDSGTQGPDLTHLAPV
jgi:hypothetical protein